MIRNPSVVLVAALFVIVFLAQHAGVVFGLSPEQRRIYDSNIGYFDTEETLPSLCSESTNLVGVENEDKIWNFLISQGFQAYQVGGIMGNLQAEAHFEPRLVEYGPPWKNSRGEVSRQGQPSSLDDNVPPDQNDKGQPGYGIVQWTSPGRKQKLRDRVAQAGTKGGDLGVQLKLLMEELQGPYKNSVYDPILAAKTLEEVSDIFMVKFENPANKSEEKKEARREMGRNIVTKHGSDSGGGASTGETVGCGSGSGEVVGGYSLPVDKRWYDEHPDWFSEAHHNADVASDIPVKTGTNVYAMAAGTVIAVDYKSDCGAGVIVDTDDGTRYKYCHGSDGSSVNGARAGDKVAAGQLIMHSASTGVSSGPHVHIEIIVSGQPRCPQPFFKSIAEGSPVDPKTLPSSGCTKG